MLVGVWFVVDEDQFHGVDTEDVMLRPFVVAPLVIEVSDPGLVNEAGAEGKGDECNDQQDDGQGVHLCHILRLPISHM